MSNIIAQGEHPFYNLRWQIIQDEYVDLDEFKEFKVIGTHGTGRYMACDEYLDSMDEFDARLRQSDIAFAKPLYMLSHSSVHISTAAFNDPWDSGQCGFAYIDKKTQEEWGIEPNDLEPWLDQAVDNYNKAANGGVVGYKIWQEKTCGACGQPDDNPLESVWGFLVDDIDIFVKEDIMPQLNYYTDKFQEAELATTAGIKSDD
jgi:hypothetical protein